MVDQNRILEEGAPRDPIERHAGRDVLEVSFDEEAEPHAEALRGILADDDRLEVHGDRILVYTEHADELTGRVRERLEAQSVLVRRAGLEDVFLRLTGRALRE